VGDGVECLCEKFQWFHNHLAAGGSLVYPGMAEDAPLFPLARNTREHVKIMLYIFT
jgi:hypothetical protein